MATSVNYDYDDMRVAVEKLQAVNSALLGILGCGMSEGAVSGMSEIVCDVVRAINPDTGTLLSKEGDK